MYPNKTNNNLRLAPNTRKKIINIHIKHGLKSLYGNNIPPKEAIDVEDLSKFTHLSSNVIKEYLNLEPSGGGAGHMNE
jgi:hypothetical protein